MANSWDELKKQAIEQVPLVTEEWASKVVTLRALNYIEFPMYKYFVRKKPTQEGETPRMKSFTDTVRYKELVKEIEEENGMSSSGISPDGEYEEDPNTEMFVFLQFITLRLKDIQSIQEAHNGIDVLKPYNYVYTTIWTKEGSYVTPVPYNFFLTRFTLITTDSIRIKVLDKDYYANTPSLKIGNQLYKKYTVQVAEQKEFEKNSAPIITVPPVQENELLNKKEDL